jgi:RIO-like serine/threonine protein kinase
MPEPVARLENGEPKPIVTLIDFPQMISTKHPRKGVIRERSGCLRRFFELKLLCTIPDHLTAGTVVESLVGKRSSEDIDAGVIDKELKAEVGTRKT